MTTFSASPSQQAVTHSVKLLLGMTDESRQQLAGVLKITPGALTHKLTARTRWSIEDLDALCAHFELTLPELVDPSAAAHAGLDRFLQRTASARETATHESQPTFSAAGYRLAA